MRYLNLVRSDRYMDRLASLLEERMSPGADKDAIDERIWDIFGVTKAIMFTDLAGFSRGVAEYGVTHFLQNIYESQRILGPCIDAHDGVLVKMEGDSMLVLFTTPQKAVRCAIAMQQATMAYNVGKIESERILLCIGIGYGRILSIGDRDVFGEEVNAASKLGEDTAGAMDILVTSPVASAAEDMPNTVLEPLEDPPQWVKGAYRLRYQLQPSA